MHHWQPLFQEILWIGKVLEDGFPDIVSLGAPNEAGQLSRCFSMEGGSRMAQIATSPDKYSTWLRGTTGAIRNF